jgi:hypothetical protein
MSADVLAWAASQPPGSQARALHDAILSGTQRVRTSGGDEVLYRSLAEMQRALTALYEASLPSLHRRPAATIARVGSGQ